MTDSRAFRPLAVLREFWAERIVIEEQAHFLEPVYFWEIEITKENKNG